MIGAGLDFDANPGGRPSAITTNSCHAGNGKIAVIQVRGRLGYVGALSAIFAVFEVRGR